MDEAHDRVALARTIIETLDEMTVPVPLGVLRVLIREVEAARLDVAVHFEREHSLLWQLRQEQIAVNRLAAELNDRHSQQGSQCETGQAEGEEDN